MAQTGYTPIQLYYSTTASAVPTNTNLANGELAINITDGKLYYKDNTGTVKLLAGAGGAGIAGGSNTQVQYNSSGNLAGDADLTFDGTTLSTAGLTASGTVTLSGGTANGVAYLNGSKVLTSGSALTFDGNQIAVTPASGNSVSKLFGGTGAGVGSYFAVYAQGANSGYFGTDSGITGSGTSNDLTIYPASTNNIRFYQGGAEQMRLTSTGLGIGTSSPANKLTVDGNANITGNTTLGDASTDTVTVNGYIGVRATPAPYYGIALGNSSAITGDVSPRGISSSAVYGSDATGTASALLGQIRTTAAAYTMANAVGVRLGDASKGAGSTITSQHGVYIEDQTQGTNNYGITSLVSSGTNKWNIYASGTAQNYFAGNVGIGTSSPAYKLDVLGNQVALSEDVLRLRSQPNSNEEYVGMLFDNNGTGVSAIRSVNKAPITSTDLAFYTSSSGTLNERMRLSADGNLGLGVTPSAWVTTAGRKAIEIGALGNALFGAGAADFSIFSNAYINTSAQTVYANNGLAARYQIPDGQHRWYTAPSGTVGNPISFTQAMTLDASGNLGVGVTSMNYPLTVAGASNGNTITAINNSSNISRFCFAQYGTPSNTYTNIEGDARSTGYLAFRTNDTERARIDSSGTFILKGGTTDNQLQFWNTAGSAEVARIGTSSGSLDFLVGSTVNVSARIDSSGNMGVGTTTTTAARLTLASTTLPALTLPNIAEIALVSGTSISGTLTVDITTQSVVYYNGNATGNWATNLRGNSGLTLNSMMSTGQSITVAVMVTQGTTAYYNTSVQIDGTTTGVTTKWQGGTAPSSGNASSVDVYSYTIIKTAASTYNVFASQTKFA